MRLYLSSYRIPNIKALKDLLQKEFIGSSVAVIINAKDYKEETDRIYKLELLKKDLDAIGFKAVDLVDLRDFTNSKEVLRKLSDFDVIYAAGGSTPSLRHAMKKCNFDEIVDELLENIVYIGESAGSYVAGPSIEVHEETDKQLGLSELPNDGLGIIEEVIIPHADNPDYQDDVKLMVDTHTAKGRKVVLLNDNQALIVNGDMKYKINGNDNSYGDRLRS